MDSDHAYLPELIGAAPDGIAKTLASEGIVRFGPALANERADQLLASLRTHKDWLTVLRQGDAAWYASQDEAKAIGEARFQAMAGAEADKGFRYLYDVLRISADPIKRAERGLTVDRLADQWSSPEAISLWRMLTGSDAVTHIEIMATRYRSGHFLTRHNDGKDPARIAAFVLSLTPKWSPDWGGELEFYGDDDSLIRSLRPSFNALTIFNVPRPHAVNRVASGIPESRYSIAGWFRDRPAVDE